MSAPNFGSGTVWTGDNLPIMRGMNSECVDLIYLDPPFNSNRHYEAPIGSQAAGASFKHAWTLDDVDLHEHGELADRNPAAYSVIEAARQAHGKGMQSYLIFMAVRLLEMRRVLKSTGSIYLHCDDAAGPYLRLLMDGIFGAGQYRNEIVWRRYGSHNDSRRYGRVHDVLLYYVRGSKWTWNGAWLPHDPAYVSQAYRHEDERGRYRTAPLHTGGLQGGGYEYEFRGHSRTWRYPQERMEEMARQDLIRQAKGGTGIPERKVYLNDNKGRPAADIWDDVKALTGQNAERTGYPTQKPLALLERVIRASSNLGDMILDPFCGCAAERLGREWAGIDPSPLAVTLVNSRISDDRAATREAKHNPVIGGSFFGGVTSLVTPPARTDLGDIPQLPDAPTPPLWGSGGRLQRLQDALPLPRHGCRSHAAKIEGWDRPSRQSPTALLRLQPKQRRQDNGRMESERTMTRVITVIEKETGYRARGRVCSQDEAEASFKRRRSEHACLLPPDSFRGYYGDDFGPDAWFVGLYLDELVKPPAEKPDVAESVIYELIAVICIAVFAGASALLAQ